MYPDFVDSLYNTMLVSIQKSKVWFYLLVSTVMAFQVSMMSFDKADSTVSQKHAKFGCQQHKENANESQIRFTIADRDPFCIFSKPKARAQSQRPPEIKLYAMNNAVDPVAQLLLTWKGSKKVRIRQHKFQNKQASNTHIVNWNTRHAKVIHCSLTAGAVTWKSVTDNQHRAARAVDIRTMTRWWLNN